MLKLATGQQMATFLKNKGVNLTKLTSAQIRNGKNGADLIGLTQAQRQALVKDTPLWFYILREAELNNGKLKGVGARIVAETFHRAIQGSTFSIVNDPSFKPTLGPKVTMDLVGLAARRGDILGADGLALVTNRPVVRIGIDRSQVGAATAGASAREVARLVDIDPAPYAKQVTAAGPLAFVEAIVYRQDEVPRGVLSGVRRVKGGAVIAGELPLAPTKGFAAPILGSVGEVTAEMIEENPDVYSIGDIAGLSGLQARYDEQLRGTPGQAVNAVGSDGKTRELFRFMAGTFTPFAIGHGRPRSACGPIRGTEPAGPRRNGRGI